MDICYNHIVYARKCVQDRMASGGDKVIYGYCRATTEKQIKDGYLDRQAELISDRYFYAEIYKEESVDLNNTPVFDNLIETLKPEDTLVITKMDRFARNISSAISIIRNLRNKGIKVHILNLGLVDDSALGKVVFNCLEAFEDFDKALLVERTQSGKAKAKQNKNFKEGRPKKYTDKQLKEAVDLLNIYSYKKVEEMTGISKSTLIRGKRQFSKSL